MAENILETLQHAVQEVIAPDVRDLKVRVASLEKQMDARLRVFSEKDRCAVRKDRCAIQGAHGGE